MKEPIPLYNLLNPAVSKEYVSGDKWCGWWIHIPNTVYDATGITTEEFPEGTIVSAGGFLG